MPLTEEFLMDRIDLIPFHECWEWNKGLYGWGLGYGRVNNVLMHRFSWELKNGSIPKGMCVLHHCDNPPCVNPHHLFLGTSKENNQDRDNKKRTAHGDKLKRKLSAYQIPNILKSAKEIGIQPTAKIYNVCPKTIREIVQNKIWKCIPRGDSNA